MPSEALIIDFDHAEQRKQFNGWVRSLKGPHRVSIRKCRPARTLPQNAWYWACAVPRVRQGLEESWGETMSDEETHEFLKARFNSKTMVNRETGEVLGHAPKSTATLDVQEFSEYLDRVIQFASEMLGVEVPQPGMIDSR